MRIAHGLVTVSSRQTNLDCHADALEATKGGTDILRKGGAAQHLPAISPVAELDQDAALAQHVLGPPLARLAPSNAFDLPHVNHRGSVLHFPFVYNTTTYAAHVHSHSP